MTIEPGSQVALVGSSGAGKSTIVSLILRFYDTTSGEIYLDNIAVRDYNVRWLRSQIGLVSQEPVLFGVSIAENIKYGTEYATDEDIIEAAKQANAHDFIIMLPQVPLLFLESLSADRQVSRKLKLRIYRVTIHWLVIQDHSYQVDKSKE